MRVYTKIQAGDIFGKWTVLSFAYKESNKSYLLCSCSCGNVMVVRDDHLKRGLSTSCGGCLSEKGTSCTKTYYVWSTMKQRCHNPNAQHYDIYGGRGIEVCERWRESYRNFLEDMGEAPEGLEIDRIDNNDGYYKENCRWVTHETNCRNKGR